MLRVFEPLLNRQPRGEIQIDLADAAQQLNPQFSNYDTECRDEARPLLPTSYSSDVNHPTRAVTLLAETRLTDNVLGTQRLDGNTQHLSINMDLLEPELGSLISKLSARCTSHTENKKQIDLLKADLESFIKLSLDYDRFDEQNIADLLYSLLNHIKSGLELILNCLEKPDTSEENRKYLYYLARLQLPLYFTNIPHSMFGMMALNLGGVDLPNFNRADAADRTRNTIDKLLREFPPDTDFSEEQIERFIKDLNNAYITAEEHALLTLGAWLNIHKPSQASAQPSDTFSRYFKFSDEEIDESILPQLNSLYTEVVRPLDDALTSLLTKLDDYAGDNSSNPNLNYFQAERWSVAILSLQGSQRLTQFMVPILEELKEETSSLPTGFKASTSVFLHNILLSVKAENAQTWLHSPEKTIELLIRQPFEHWLLDGIFHFLDEAVDNPYEESRDMSRIQAIKTDVLQWLDQSQKMALLKDRTELQDGERVRIFHAIEQIAESMVSIRKGIDVDPDEKQKLLDHMLKTEFIKMTYDHFSTQRIVVSNGHPTPVEQLTSIFSSFEVKLNSRRFDLFSWECLKTDVVRNTKLNLEKPIEEWQIKFTEAVLFLDQHTKLKKTPEIEKHSAMCFLKRNYKSPSFLGRWVMKAGKPITWLFFHKWYHQESGSCAKAFAEKRAQLQTRCARLKPHCIEEPSTVVDLSGTCELEIDIDWNKGPNWTGQNFLHDSDANHDDNGMLTENVGGLDYALPSFDVLKNWYEVMTKATESFFPTYSLESITDAEKATEINKFQILSRLHFNSNRPSSVDDDHSNFLLEIVFLLPFEIDNPSQIKTLIKQAIKQYGKNTLIRLSPRESRQEEKDIKPVALPIEFCKSLSTFFQTIASEISTLEFRHDLTADVHSFQILQQLTGFLNIPVQEGTETTKMYKLLGMADCTFNTLENYYYRLTSEYFQHKSDLVGERFYEMSSGAPPLSRKNLSFLAAIKNYSINDFMADVEAQLEEESRQGVLKSQPINVPGMSLIMEDIQASYEKVLTKLREELKQLNNEDVVVVSVTLNGTIDESKATATRIDALEKKILAGKGLLKNLEDTIKALRLNDENLQPTDRWKSVTEWVENHEAGIMAVYCGTMIASIVYLLIGGTYPAKHYATGGKLPFGSFDIGITSLDPFQVVTTIGAVFTQFAQASGWQNDIRRMLKLLKEADSFPFITTELPPSFQSDMMNLYLSQYTPDDGLEKYDKTRQEGNYLTRFNCKDLNKDRAKDMAKDVLASALTRRSPLQKSHFWTDRAIRVVSSTSIGALGTGPAFAGLSKVTSLACMPCCPTLAPIINFAPTTLMLCCGGAGFFGGVLSDLPYGGDYVSRCLNYPIRIFGDDRTMGGMRELSDQVAKAMLKREGSTLVRLCVENPFKAALNISGFSLPESFVKGCLHLVDGWIAQTEISDFAQWRKAHQRLRSAAAAFNKYFEGKALTPYDQKALVDTLGTENARALLGDLTLPQNKMTEFKRFIAGAVNGVGYYVMIADLYAFLYAPIDKAWTYHNSVASMVSETTGQPVTGSATDNITPSLTEASKPLPDTSTDRSESSLLMETKPSSTAAGCPANTKKLPKAGKGWGECELAIYEEARKGDPEKGFWENAVSWKRFGNVLMTKSVPNYAHFEDVKLHNAALGKKSYDPAMVVTLKAGLAKNSFLGPLERLCQMSDQIALKCIGDIINQANTNIKEAMESVGQRERDKATVPMKKAGNDVIWRLLDTEDYDSAKTETTLVNLLSHWQDNIGFHALKAFGDVRQSYANEELAKCPATERDFPSYKKEVMSRLRKDLPTMSNKSAVIPQEKISDVARLNAKVGQFRFDINEGKDMYQAASALLKALAETEKDTVDWYIESLLFGVPLNASRSHQMERPDEARWKRVQHKYGQPAVAAT